MSAAGADRLPPAPIAPSRSLRDQTGAPTASTDLSAAIRSGTFELTLMVGAGIACWFGIAVLVVLAIKGAGG